MLIAIDTETTGLNPWKGARVYSIGIYTGKQKLYWEWPVDPKTRKVQYGKNPLDSVLIDFLCDPYFTHIYHNAKFDRRLLRYSFGVQLHNNFHDTYIAARCCKSDEDINGGYGLKI